VFMLSFEAHSVEAIIIGCGARSRDRQRVPQPRDARSLVLAAGCVLHSVKPAEVAPGPSRTAFRATLERRPITTWLMVDDASSMATAVLVTSTSATFLPLSAQCSRLLGADGQCDASH